MKFAVITPFSRYQNKYNLIEHLHPLDILWYPLIFENEELWPRLWIRPIVLSPNPQVFDACYYKLNQFLSSGLIRDELYYSFLNDDDHYEPDFFDKIRKECTGDEKVIIVSMKRTPEGLHDLIADRKNMSEGFVGLEQMIIKGSILKNLRFVDYSHSADGKLAGQIADGAKYLKDVFVLFNYLEPGRWTK